MTLPPTRGWRIDLALWAPLLIFAAGLLCMKLAPLLTLPTVLILLWAAPPVGHLADKLSLNAYAFHPLRQGKNLFVIYLAGIPLTVLWIVQLRYLDISFSTVQPAAALLRNASGWDLVGALTLILVTGPLAEEILFRRMLYDLFSRLAGPRIGLVLTAAGFSAMHFFLVGFPILFVCGLIFQLAYLRSGSLAVSMELHILYNLVGVTSLLLTGGAGA